MFTWIKKRCRRQSAPSCDTLKKSRKRPAPGTDVTKPFYFELEKEFIDHSYEEIADVGTTSGFVFDMAEGVTSLTRQLEDEFSSSSEVCLICRKTYSLDNPGESECSCYAHPIGIIYQNVTGPNSDNTGGKRRAAEDYDALDLRYSSDHIYSSLRNEKRRRLFRSRSDIRRRPLPELPFENEELSDSDTSGFYEDVSLVGPYVSESVLV